MQKSVEPSSPFFKMLIWLKTLNRYYEEMLGEVLGVGTTAKNEIAVELGASSGNLRLGVLVKPKENTIVHSCPAVKKKTPCWHLAAGLDAAYYVAGKKLRAPQKGPVAEVIAVDKKTPRVTVVRDLTPGYLESRGCNKRDGDFKIFKYSPEPDPEPDVVANDLKPRLTFGRFCKAVLALLRVVRA